MGKLSVVKITTGPAGTGKSYAQCSRFIVDEFLPDFDGVHWSNFPILMDGLCDLAQRKRGIDPDETRSRVKTIPFEVLKTWERAESGPWDFFKDIPLDKTHIAIDEIHVYCGRNRPREVRERWQRWLGDIRHAGATIEFLSQAPQKIAKELDYECAVRLEFISAAHRRDPFFRIPVGDWYELLACIIRRWHETVIAHEYRQEKGRWTHNHTYAWRLDPSYFPAYDSFNQTREDGKSGKGELKQWEKRSIPGVFLWFFLRHPWRILTWTTFFAFIFYLIFGGGSVLLGVAFQYATKTFTPTMKQKVSGDNIQLAGVAQASPQAGGDTEPSQDFAQVSPQIATTQPVIPPETLAEIAKLKTDLQAARQRELESFSVVLLEPEIVTFRGGYSYRVGEVIDFGPFDGHIIERIDYEKRMVHLSAGVVLRMGRAFRLPAVKPDSGSAGESTGVSGPVQPPSVGNPPSSGRAKR